MALIVPDAEFAKAYARRKLADLDELVQHKDFERAIGEAVARANESLSVIERVRHFRLMAKPFTVENGTMTPTLKLKRPLIYRLHKGCSSVPAPGQRPGSGARRMTANCNDPV